MIYKKNKTRHKGTTIILNTHARTSIVCAYTTIICAKLSILPANATKRAFYFILLVKNYQK